MEARGHIHIFTPETRVGSPPIMEKCFQETQDLAAAPKLYLIHTTMGKEHSLVCLLCNTTSNGKTNRSLITSNRKLVTYGWEKELAEVQPDVENIFMISGRHFISRLFKFISENWTAGECWQNSTEKHKMMKHTQTDNIPRPDLH